MGYGKTITTLAIMVENAPKKGARNRTTLIVVPASLKEQWLSEIAKHISDNVMEDVLVYTSSLKDKVNNVVEFLQKRSVVIASYHEVMRNYPKCEIPPCYVTEAAKDAWWADYFEQNKGPLLSMPFYRVVLDEGHIIKNFEARTSKACRMLTAKYKWILSGTPITNSMNELAPYFMFLGVEGAGSYAQFCVNFCKRNPKTQKRLDAILRMIMIRRTGADRMFGAPLVNLPPLDYQLIEIAFNPVERTIYSVVRQRFITRINDWSVSNKMSQLSRNIFVMLMRLRQMCGHVLSISSTFKDLLEIEDIQKLSTAFERFSQGARSEPSTRTAKVLQKVLRETSDEDTEVPSGKAFLQPYETIDLTIDDNAFDYRAVLQQLQEDGALEEIRNRSQCSACSEVPVDSQARISNCGHLYCSECIDALLQPARNQNINKAECLACNNIMTGAVDLSVLESIAQYPNLQLASPSIDAVKAAKKSKADLKWLETPGVEKLSTKIQAVTATMSRWLDEDADAKIVVFTLFLPLVTLLGKVCKRNGWLYQEYTGAVSSKRRSKALAEWKDPESDNKVLLMSMRAGGLGLNLTEASYVIIIDPWWNEPVEDQAFSRVYRIGQTKRCVVRKFVVKDAIDTQLMLRLQRLKAQECDRVIDGRSKKDLSTEDIMKMFGPTQIDSKTGQLIIVDDDKEEDGTDEFIVSQDCVRIIDSDGEDLMPAPGRPRE